MIVLVFKSVLVRISITWKCLTCPVNPFIFFSIFSLIFNIYLTMLISDLSQFLSLLLPLSSSYLAHSKWSISTVTHIVLTPPCMWKTRVTEANLPPKSLLTMKGRYLWYFSLWADQIGRNSSLSQIRTWLHLLYQLNF